MLNAGPETLPTRFSRLGLCHFREDIRDTRSVCQCNSYLSWLPLGVVDRDPLQSGRALLWSAGRPVRLFEIGPSTVLGPALPPSADPAPLGAATQHAEAWAAAREEPGLPGSVGSFLESPVPEMIPMANGESSRHRSGGFFDLRHLGHSGAAILPRATRPEEISSDLPTQG
eukprot:gene13718-biopygen6559